MLQREREEEAPSLSSLGTGPLLQATPVAEDPLHAPPPPPPASALQMLVQGRLPVSPQQAAPLHAGESLGHYAYGCVCELPSGGGFTSRACQSCMHSAPLHAVRCCVRAGPTHMMPMHAAQHAPPPMMQPGPHPMIMGYHPAMGMPGPMPMPPPHMYGESRQPRTCLAQSEPQAWHAESPPQHNAWPSCVHARIIGCAAPAGSWLRAGISCLACAALSKTEPVPQLRACVCMCMCAWRRAPRDVSLAAHAPIPAGLPPVRAPAHAHAQPAAHACAAAAAHAQPGPHGAPPARAQPAGGPCASAARAARGQRFSKPAAGKWAPHACISYMSRPDGQATVARTGMMSKGAASCGMHTP